MTAEGVPAGRTGEHRLDAERDHKGGAMPAGARPPMTAETTLPRMLAPDMHKALTAAGRNVAKWTAERDRLVKEAVAAGGSLREVGEAAGISHTAVKFIAHGRPNVSETKHAHEWQAHGLVREQRESRSPCSRLDDVLWTEVYAVQSCSCGKVTRSLVANENERRRGDDLRRARR